MIEKLKIVGVIAFFCIPGSLLFLILVGLTVYIYNALVGRIK